VPGAGRLAGYDLPCRPYTSTDNPYSEAHFKTLKYRPEFPQRFDSIEHARAHCRAFFHWYNHITRTSA
jgi:putative transposase